ncbi:MAG: ParA family protein [Candidatus Neomarinimicrobiota bacterium]
MDIISIVNQKGGTGKTTTAINLGAALATFGKKVLLIDLDPQANLTYSLGIIEPEGSMADVFAGTRDLNSILVDCDNLKVAPSSTELVNVEIAIIDDSNREKYLMHSLKKHQNEYDYILVDVPPSLSVLTLNALFASTSLIIPLQMEVLTMRGLVQLLETIEEFRREYGKRLIVKGIAAVKYDSRRKLSSEILNHIKTKINGYIFKTVIRENVRIAEAPSYATSVIHYAPRSNGARDYLALAKELLQRNRIRRL